MWVRRTVTTCTLLALCALAAAQSLDWSGDMPLFATSGNERDPAVIITPAGRTLRALCVSDEAILCMKTSTDDGASWSVCDTLPAPIPSPRIRAAADRQFQYVFLSGASAAKSLYRFTPRANNWHTAVQCTVAAECSGHVVASAMMNDEAAQLGDPYVNLAWIERAPQTNHYSLWFAQTQDRGATFQPTRSLCSFDSPDAIPDGIDVTASWSGGEERLIVAATVDRPGSIPEEIRIFTSGDEGVTWGDSTAVDDAGYAQREPSLAAYGNMVVLVYSRRVNASSQRDLFLSYSPDGGVSFSPAMAITDSMADEHSPKVIMSDDGSAFNIFYLCDNGVDEAATVLVRGGDVATPWTLSGPTPLCETGAAVRDGGLCAAAGHLGATALWAARFPLGDTDVMYDASWRGMSVQPADVAKPSRIFLGQNFPNPFNGTTILPLTLDHAASVAMMVTDITGRTVFVRHMGFLPAGQSTIPLDLSGLASGPYWVSLRGSPHLTRRLLLVR
ncbi:MAG TPA: hypothetical protein VGL38_04420 [bacterium]|jgi:hypothetical protein